MDQIPRVEPGKQADIKVFSTSSNTGSFSAELKRAQDGELLRHTSNNGKGTGVCQGNDASAVEKISNPDNKPFQISDDTLLVLSAGYKKWVLNNSLIGYGDSKKLFLPLTEIARTLDFDIGIDSQNGTARGWFISEDRKFSLDLPKMQAISDGEKTTIPDGAVFSADSEFYVDAELLSKWFPVDFSYDFSNQSVNVEPREKLAFELRLERENAWKNLRGAQLNEAVFPREYSEHEWLSPPVVDVGVTASHSNEDGDYGGLNSSFYLLSKGDIGKMTSEIYLSGDTEDGLDNSSLTLKRDDPDGNLLGPLKARSVAVGDIRTAEFPVIGGGETERGFAISNEKLEHRSREFDTTFFEGSLPPGWDVEVYRNNVLIETQRVGAEGRYSFNKIPVYYGKNDFQLVFYGPQGQKREERKRIDVGNDMLQKGESEYDISLTQKNSVLHDPDRTGHTLDEKGLKLNARYEYGLGKNLSLSTGISSQEVNGKRHNYLDLGARGNFKGASLSGDLMHDTGGGNALELSALTGLGKLNLNLKQRFYDDFLDDSGGDVSDPLKSQTQISASGKIDGNSFIPDIPFTLSYSHLQREDSRYSAFGSSLATRIKNINLNNYLRLTNNSNLSDEPSVLDGTFKAITQIGDLRLRGMLDYEIKPEAGIERAEISGLLKINDKLNSELVLEKDIEEDYSGATLKFNWNNGKYTISPQVSYNSDGEFTAFLGFSTSFGIKPRSKQPYLSSTRMADTGAASVRVFNDKNNNAVFDEGDEVVKGASVKAVQSFREAETDADGVAFIPLLQKNRPTDIVIDRETLEDPFWEPSTPSHSIVPRPGHVQQMDIPVVTTSEIDGTILTEAADGTEQPMANVTVQLMDDSGKVVKQVRSEYDGFYYFQKVFPGNYSVRIDPDARLKNGNIPEPETIEIGNEGTVASGRDIFITRKTELVSDKSEPLEHDRATADITTPVPESAVSQNPEPRGETPQYGLHLSSYRTREKAVAGIDYLKKKYNNILDSSSFTIKEVKVSDQKGIWYRVVAGSFADSEAAAELKKEIKKSSSYCKIVPLNDNLGTQKFHGVHLTSFRTEKKALQSIEELKSQYPALLKDMEFSIRDVDLGAKMGKWKRVIAGRFENSKAAAELEKEIKKSSPYCKIVPLNDNRSTQKFHGVHLTSFRTEKKALQSIEELKSQYPALLKDMEFSIRDVDLGAKMGKWKRVIAGRFVNPVDAKMLVEKIKMKNPYCKIMEIEKDNEFSSNMKSRRTSEIAARTSEKAAVESQRLMTRHYSLLSENKGRISSLNVRG